MPYMEGEGKADVGCVAEVMLVSVACSFDV